MDQGLRSKRICRLLRVGSAAAVLAVPGAGCARDGAGPESGSFPMSIAAQVGTSGPGAARAFDAADAAAVRVSVGGAVVLEATRSLTGGGDLVLNVALDRGLVGSTVDVEVTLLAAGAPVFRGSGQAALAEAGTSVELELAAVIARIEVADPVRVFTAIGETARFTGAAVFATGDTVPGVPLSWQALDAGVVAVEADGDATALDAGEARVEASGGGMVAVTHARVDPQVEQVEVSPPSANLAIGETAVFEAAARDRNGNLLSLPVTWASTSTAVATITAAGVATALAEGRTTIRATAGGVTGEAELVVRATPRSPDGLEATITGSTGGDFLLTWQDRSDDEARFDIERSVNGGPWERIGSTEVNVVRFVGPGAPGTNAFRVSACNTNGCSAPSNEATLVFASGPPSAETLASPDIGVMRGRVDTPGAYRVRFVYGEGCLCLVTPWVVRTAPGEYTQVLPPTYPGTVFDYRIEAENGFGTDVGETLTLTIPYIDISAPSEYEAMEEPFPISLSITMPQGTAESPIASVDWRPDGGSIGATSLDVEDSGSQVRFVYRSELLPSSIFGHYLNAAVIFRSGLEVFVEGPCIAGPQGSTFFCFDSFEGSGVVIGSRARGPGAGSVTGRWP